MDPRPSEHRGLLASAIGLRYRLGVDVLGPSPRNTCPESSFFIWRVGIRTFALLASQGLPVDWISWGTEDNFGSLKCGTCYQGSTLSDHL